MEEAPIPVLVIDDTPVKRRGICEYVEETPHLELFAQAGDTDSIITLVEDLYMQQVGENPSLEGYLVLSDLRLGSANGIELGRSLLRIAPGLRIVIYTQDPSWTLAAEIFRQEYERNRSRRGEGKRLKKQQGLHGYALFSNMQPSYLARIATKVIRRHETFIDPEVLDYLLKKLQGQRLTPRQEECAALIAKGLSNDDIALRMGYFNISGKPNIGPVENLVSELYSFFVIEGAPSDPGRRVMLAHAYEAYSGQRSG
jgi:two-component system, NarL family, nitrate/nitrite response regulator NarL